MKVLIISYSLSGNNDSLASSIVLDLGATHVRVTESKKRTVGTIAFDMLFNRTPPVSSVEERPEEYDLVVLVGPVWMGKVASPLRGPIRQLKTSLNRYAFVSISGGALGKNPKLGQELKKRTGREPVAVIDMQIVDLMPKDKKPSSAETSKYRLTESDIRTLTDQAVVNLRKLL